MSAQDCIKRIIEKTGSTEKAVLKALDMAEKELSAARANNYFVDVAQLSKDNALALMQQEKIKKFEKLRLVENKMKLKQNTQTVLDKYRAGGKIDKVLEQEADLVKSTIRSQQEDWSSNLYNELEKSGVTEFYKERSEKNVVAKYISQLTKLDAEGKPMIRSGGLSIDTIPAEERMAYRVAEAWAKTDDIIRSKFERLGAPIGFLEGRVGKNMFNPRLIAVNQATRDAFAQDLLRVAEWDKIYTGTKTKEEFAKALSDKIGSGVRGQTRGVDDIFSDVIDDVIGETSLPGGSLAKRLGKNRTIHINPDEWNDFMEKWGYGDVYDHMERTISSSSRDAVLLNKFGGNPEKAWGDMLDILQKESPELGQAGEHPLGLGKYTRRMGEVLTGSSDVPENVLVAKIFDTSRNYLQTTLLRNSLLRSLPDMASQASREAAFYGSTAVGEQMSLFAKAFGDNLKARAGQFGDELVNSYYKSQRKAFEFIGREVDSNFGLREITRENLSGGAGLTDKFLDGMNSVHDQIFKRINFTNWWTNVGFDARMTQFSYQLGELSGKTLEELNPITRKYLSEVGLDKYWNMIRKRGVIDAEGDKYLLPNMFADLADDEVRAFAGRDLSNRELANLKEQIALEIKGSFYQDASTSMSMPGVGLKSRLAGIQRGTIPGEIARSFMQFKSYPIMFLSNIISPLIQNKQIGVLAGGIGTYTAITYMSDTMLDLISGKTPKDYSPNSKEGLVNMANLAFKAIGLPWVDEIILGAISPEGIQMEDGLKLAGPVPTSFFKTLVQTGNIGRGIIEGDPDKALANAAKLIYEAPVIGPLTHGHILGNAVNNIFNSTLIEMFKPGTIKSMDEFAQKQGQRYYSLVNEFPEFVQDVMNPAD
jgi:hypothetical protein